MLQARIQGVVFDGAPRQSSNIIVIDPEGFSGWDDGVYVRREEVSRPNGHGWFDAAGYLSGRVVELSGWMVADTPAGLRVLRDRVAAIGSFGAVHRLTVQTDQGTQWCDVRLAEQPQITVTPEDPRFADYQIQFWAADPFKFGDVRQFPGDGPLTQVHHRGNTHAYPVLEVTGASSGWTVTCAGRSVTVTQSLSAGQVHRYDTRTGRLYRNGVLQSGVASGNIVNHPAGVVRSYVLSGSGSLAVKLTDTFI